MAVSKMTVLARTLAIMGFFAPGAITAETTYANAATTETVTPQELGSMTSDGLLIHSFNYCTVVHSTGCEVSISTDSSAIESSTSIDYASSTEDAYGTTSTPYAPPEGEPSSVSEGGGGGEPSSDGGASTTDNGDTPSATEDHGPSHSPSEDGGASSEITSETGTPTATDDEGTATNSASGSSTATAAAAPAKILPGMAIGAAGLAVAAHLL